MKIHPRIFIPVLFLCLASLACGLPFGSAQPAPAVIESSQPTSLPGGAPTIVIQTDTPAASSPNQTAVVQSQPTNSQVSAQSSLSTVVLLAADFPTGFSPLDVNSQQTIGVTQETVAGMFQGTFSQAKPSNYFVFLNPSPDTYQLVLGTLFSPLTPNESSAFDLDLADSAKATKSFTSGLGNNANVIDAANKLGEKSIGFTFTTQANTIMLRGDLVMVRRGNVVAILLTMYQDGFKPPADLLKLAGTLDDRLKTALNP
jgi:hypothetical protein